MLSSVVVYRSLSHTTPQRPAYIIRVYLLSPKEKSSRYTIVTVTPHSHATHARVLFTLLGVAVCSALIVLCVYVMQHISHHTSLSATPTAHAQTTVSGTELCPLKNDLFLNPFNKDSAHHRPIGTGARYADDNHPAVRDWVTKGSRFNINVATGPFGLLMTEAPPNGPIIRVNVEPGGSGSGLPADVRFPVGGVDPNYPQRRDGNIAIFDRVTNRFQHIRHYQWNNGRPTGLQYRIYDPRTLGHPTRMGERIGTSASGVASPFGILRGVEVSTPGMPIRHALQMAIPGRGDRIMLSREIILPAATLDNFCNPRNSRNNPSYCTGNIPYGSLWALPPNVNLDAMGLSEPGKRLAEAIRDYGVYVVDDGNGPALRADQNFTPALRNQLVSDTEKFYPLMRMVLNSAWQPGGGPAGGGTPIAPNCAFDAPDDGSAPTTTQVPDSVAGGGAQAGTGTTQPGAGVPGVVVGSPSAPPVVCHLIGPNSTPPRGYGAPYNIFSGRSMLIEGRCRQEATEVIVGDRQRSTYVFGMSYYWNGTEWVEVSLAGDQPQGAWFVGRATGSFPRLANRMWYVAYTCHNTDNGWRCGCINQACRESRWQVQGFMTNFPDIPQPAPSAGGGIATGGVSDTVAGGGQSGGGTAYTGGSGTAECPLKNDLFLNPFNKDSAHHRPIGTGAVYAGESHPVTQVWKKVSRISINNPSPHGTAFAVAENNHPTVTLTHRSCPRWNHNPSGSGFPLSLRLPPNFPPNFSGEDCWDNAGAILDRSSGTIREFYELNPNSRTASLVRSYDVRGTGHATQLGQRVGMTATGMSTIVGAVRGHELEAIGQPIRHAYHLAIPATTVQASNTGLPQLLSRNIQWPATTADTSSRNIANNNGPIPYGALLAIPPVSKGGPDLSTLGLSEPGLRMAEAMRDYGVYVIDNASGVVLRSTDVLGGNIGTQARADMRTIAPYLRLVTNSVTGATAAVVPGDTLRYNGGSIGTPTWPAGGGQPIAPNCAFDAP